MANTVCLLGPAFSLTGDISYPDQGVEFQLVFDSSEDQESVKAYNWYLDGNVIIDQNLPDFSGDVPCGTHTIGAQILSAEGWSGVKTLVFKTCRVVVSAAIVGPDEVANGGTVTYTVIETYNDDSTEDATEKYTFSNADGTFEGNVFTASLNNDPTHASSITATGPDFEPQKDISIITRVASILIYGPNEIVNGQSGTYSVIVTYNDTSTADVTADYTFTSPDGTFVGGVFTSTENTDPNHPSTITAAGPDTLYKEITILSNGTSDAIVGPGSVTQGSTGEYTVIRTHASDGSTEDVTSLYTFTSPDGTFVGGVFTPNATGATHGATITASFDGNNLTKNITVVYIGDQAGVLVIDLFNNNSLNVVGYYDNGEGDAKAYTGYNFYPAGTSAADALILASDLAGSSGLSWRFEFNVKSLILANPGATQLSFYLKARATTAGTLSGAYGLKTYASVMGMAGSPGSYVPNISGGNLSSPQTFNTYVVSGANGSYADSDLTLIATFIYHIDTREMEMHYVSAP